MIHDYLFQISTYADLLFMFVTIFLLFTGLFKGIEGTKKLFMQFPRLLKDLFKWVLWLYVFSFVYLFIPWGYYLYSSKMIWYMPLIPPDKLETLKMGLSNHYGLGAIGFVLMWAYLRHLLYQKPAKA